MRISDWSSDVCSSDLDIARKIGQTAFGQRRVAQVVHDHLPRNAVGAVRVTRRGQIPEFEPIAEPHTFLAHKLCGEHNIAAPAGKRTEGRRVGKGWVSTCKCRWSPVK